MEFHSEKDLEQEQPHQEQEEEEELCDSSFIVEGIDMNAHKAVLAACSAYFRAIFMHQKDMARMNTSKTTGWKIGNLLVFISAISLFCKKKKKISTQSDV